MGGGGEVGEGVGGGEAGEGERGIVNSRSSMQMEEVGQVQSAEMIFSVCSLITDHLLVVGDYNCYHYNHRHHCHYHHNYCHNTLNYLFNFFW